MREASQDGFGRQSQHASDFEITQALEVEQTQDEPALELHAVQCFQHHVGMQRRCVRGDDQRLLWRAGFRKRRDSRPVTAVPLAPERGEKPSFIDRAASAVRFCLPSLIENTFSKMVRALVRKAQAKRKAVSRRKIFLHEICELDASARWEMILEVPLRPGSLRRTALEPEPRRTDESRRNCVLIVGP